MKEKTETIKSENKIEQTLENEEYESKLTYQEKDGEIIYKVEMKEKTADIDILEEKENIRLEDKYKQTLKMAEEVRKYVCERNSGCEPSQAECLAYNMQYVKKYVETLISENKELKEENEEIKKELSHLKYS